MFDLLSRDLVFMIVSWLDVRDILSFIQSYPDSCFIKHFVRHYPMEHLVQYAIDSTTLVLGCNDLERLKPEIHALCVCFLKGGATTKVHGRHRILCAIRDIGNTLGWWICDSMVHLRTCYTECGCGYESIVKYNSMTVKTDGILQIAML